MATEAKRRATIAYNKRHDNIMVRPTKEHGAKIRAAAAAAEMSVQAFVLQAVDAWIAANPSDKTEAPSQPDGQDLPSGEGGTAKP